MSNKEHNKKQVTKRGTTSKPKLNDIGIYDKSFIPKKFQDVSALLLLFIIQVIFMNSVYIKTKTISSPDKDLPIAYSKSVNKEQANDGNVYWNRHTFSGMPNAANLGAYIRYSDYDLVSGILLPIFGILPLMLNNDGLRLLTYGLIFSFGLFYYLRIKQFTPFQAFIVAAASIFSLSFLSWFIAWHSLKGATIMSLPWILAFFEKIKCSKNTKLLFVYTTCLTLALWPIHIYKHIQIAYYVFIVIGLYFTVFFIHCILKQESWKSFLRVLLAFILAFSFSVISKIDIYAMIYDYTKYSVRSAKNIKFIHPELEGSTQEKATPSDINSNNTDKPSEGLDYDYATSWSYPVQEVINFFIPSYFGYGGQTYWGDMPFTASPIFFGIIILLLAIIGCVIYRRDSTVQMLIAVAIFSLLLSFGNYFPLFFDIFFNYFPFFNKFRTPSMILVIVEFSVFILSAFGLRALFEWKNTMSDKSKDTAKKIMVGTIIACIIIFLISTSFKSTYLDQIAESTFGKNYIAQYGKTYPDIIQRVDTQLGIYSKMRSDLIISLILVIAFTLSVYYFITKKLGKTVFQTILFGLVVFDFGRASAPMLAEIKVPQSKTKLLPKSTAEPDYVNFIKQDYAEYRVLPYVSEPSSAAFTGFSIESVDGYHPAKLRIYQDLMDVFADGVTQKPRFFDNPLLMELLNIKYIILDQASLIPNFQVVFNGSKVVLKNNNNALRYWFVDSVFVQSDLQIIKSIKEQSFNPKTVAFITNNGSTLPPISPTDSASSIKVIERTAHKVTLSTFVPKGNHFMFIGEIFYPVGWKCYIDGVPTEIFKTNYAFRGIVVPEGNHTITMVYEDSIIKTFRPFAIFANLTTFVALLLSLFFVADSYRKKYLKSKNVVSKEESSGSPFSKN